MTSNLYFQIYKQEELKSFFIELNVRAVAVDHNYLEKLKQSASTNRADAERVKTTEVDLAKNFSYLTELAKSNTRVARECTLKPFWLTPPPERYATAKKYQNGTAATIIAARHRNIRSRH